MRVFHISVCWWSFSEVWVTASIFKSPGLFSTRPLISKSSTSFNNHSMTIPITWIYNWYQHDFYVAQFFHFPSKVQSLILPIIFFQFYSMVSRDSKVRKFATSLFRPAESWWSVCISKSQRSLCVSFSRSDVWSCIYYMFVWSNLSFLHNPQWIPLPTQLCVVLHSFSVNLLHSLIMWLIGSPLSQQNLHLLFCWVLSILALIWLVFYGVLFRCY